MSTGKGFSGPNFDKQELTLTELLHLHTRLKEEERSICREFIDAVNSHNRDRSLRSPKRFIFRWRFRANPLFLTGNAGF